MLHVEFHTSNSRVELTHSLGNPHLRRTLAILGMGTDNPHLAHCVLNAISCIALCDGRAGAHLLCQVLHEGGHTVTRQLEFLSLI